MEDEYNLNEKPNAPWHAPSGTNKYKPYSINSMTDEKRDIKITIKRITAKRIKMKGKIGSTYDDIINRAFDHLEHLIELQNA